MKSQNKILRKSIFDPHGSLGARMSIDLDTGVVSVNIYILYYRTSLHEIYMKYFKYYLVLRFPFDRSSSMTMRQMVEFWKKVMIKRKMTSELKCLLQ